MLLNKGPIRDSEYTKTIYLMVNIIKFDKLQELIDLICF